MKAKTGKIWFSDLLTATIVRKTTNRTLGKMHPIRFCARLAHFAEGKPPLRQAAPRQNRKLRLLLRSACTTLRDCIPLRQAAPRQNANFVCFCARLALSLASNSIRTQMKTLTFISLMTTSVACLGSCTNPAASDAQQPWIVDRFDDIKVIRYEVPGFERLPLEQTGCWAHPSPSPAPISP